MRRSAHARLLAVATVSLLATGTALTAAAVGQAGDGEQHFTADDDTRIVVKYYEGIPTDGDSPPKSFGQTPNLDADRAIVYNDSSGYCTIGWGHLIGKRGCNGTDYAKYGNPKDGDGWTFDEANNALDPDIQRTALDPLDKCITVPLTPGQLRAMVGLLYNTGPNTTINRIQYLPRKKKGGKRPYKIVSCGGPFTKALNARKFAEVPDLIRRFQRAQGPRGGWEVYDFTDGKQGSTRPPIWNVATAIQTDIVPGLKQTPSAATITVTPTGQRDDLSGVTPKTDSIVCATTVKGQKVAERCGPFYTDEQVEIKATTKASDWRFSEWLQVDDDTNSRRDLCATDGQQNQATCTVDVQDQLVRAIAVFVQTCPAKTSRAAGSVSADVAPHCPLIPTVPPFRSGRH